MLLNRNWSLNLCNAGLLWYRWHHHGRGGKIITLKFFSFFFSSPFHLLKLGKQFYIGCVSCFSCGSKWSRSTWSWFRNKQCMSKTLVFCTPCSLSNVRCFLCTGTVNPLIRPSMAYPGSAFTSTPTQRMVFILPNMIFTQQLVHLPLLVPVLLPALASTFTSTFTRTYQHCYQK